MPESVLQPVVCFFLLVDFRPDYQLEPLYLLVIQHPTMSHSVFTVDNDIHLTITEVGARKDILRKAGRCYVCLRKNHVSKDCRLCRGRHHVTSAIDKEPVKKDITPLAKISLKEPHRLLVNHLPSCRRELPLPATFALIHKLRSYFRQHKCSSSTPRPQNSITQLEQSWTVVVRGHT